MQMISVGSGAAVPAHGPSYETTHCITLPYALAFSARLQFVTTKRNGRPQFTFARKLNAICEKGILCIQRYTSVG